MNAMAHRPRISPTVAFPASGKSPMACTCAISTRRAASSPKRSCRTSPPAAASERCLWITAAPLHAAAAQAELRQAGLDVDAASRNGSIVIRDYSAWHSQAEQLRGSEVVELWLEEERQALAGGYSGLRMTGNTIFLKPQDWGMFMEYETLIGQAFAGRRIVTLCSYLLGQLGAADVLDVAPPQHHSHAPRRRLAGPHDRQLAAGRSPPPRGRSARAACSGGSWSSVPRTRPRLRHP